jgi:allophanate hydrolase subunit 2
VITADLPLMAQLRPGDRVRFVRTALDVAQDQYRRIEHDLSRAQRALQLRFAAGTDGSY